MPEAPYLDALNPDQRRAVEHGISPAGVGGPLLVIAGAGSGKTNTLAHRVAHLIVNGADPQRILLMTFSRRASMEMGRRVERIVANAVGVRGGLIRLDWSGTFHSIGARLLREYASYVGLDPSFTIHDREDSADLLNIVRHDLGFSETESRFPAKGTCLAIYSRTVNEENALPDVLLHAFPWCAGWQKELSAIFAGYVAAKQAQNVLDYDDLLLYWAAILEEPAIAADIGTRFDHVLVDEYQDTNRLQARVLKALKPDGRGLAVVGDDAQSIYSFRAATVRNILDFPGQFSPAAAVVTLAQNYRSTGPILDASNAVIGLATERYTKDLWTDRSGSHKPLLVTVADEAGQAAYVADRVLDERETGVPLKAQAVLFRASHHSGPLEIELARRNIPFVKFGGLKFLDTAHVKDVLAVLRFAENPRDRVSGFRVLQLLPGIGPAVAAEILERCAHGSDLRGTLAAVAPPQRAVEAWPVFTATLLELAGGASEWPADLERVRLWYEPHLERIHEDAAARRNDILQLEQIASGYPSRERFLTEITLDPPDATSDNAGPPHLDDDYLILSTIHSAKGQEWKAVYILNAADGCIPSDLATGSSDELEEERRLLYVAMTRAKDALHVIVPQRCYVTNQARSGDRHVYTQRTRFIPDAIANRFEIRVWPEVRDLKASLRRSLSATKVDVRAKLRQRWAT
jgi:ATP-dependent DNA helicase UvrD/PcrA